ncbi:MAG: M20 family metallopeptidase [Symbiobacteriaceae bacterium]|nr:M20 family metallopeptidase [Symbiobacteriaceae bacterium]
MAETISERIKTFFAQYQDELVADLLELVRAESPTNNKAAANDCCDILCQIVARRLGVTGTRYPSANFADHVLFKVGNGARNMLLVGHYDTVWDVGAKDTSHEGDIIKGPGVFDMKFGIISSIWSLKAIQDLQLPFDKTVYLLYNSDEEVGSPTSQPIILANPSLYEAALILEPSYLGGIKTERKGVGMIDVRVTGLASHAGSNYEQGLSAIDEAAKIVSYLHSLTDLELGTTVSVGLIQGGTRRNVVAAECSLKADFRVRTAAEGERLLSQVQAIKPSRPGITVDILGELNRPPFEKTPGNMALFHKLQATAEYMGFAINEIATGGGSDGNFTSFAGIPTLDGLGAVGDGGHALHEYIELAASLERTMLLTAFWSRC